jgi:vacuolar-type H+-ATPase subunit I/STV1
MKTALQTDLSFDQILSVVQQLLQQQKLRLTKELEKEGIDTKLSRLLESFKTKDLDLKTIANEIESVRQEIYDKQKQKR